MATWVTISWADLASVTSVRQSAQLQPKDIVGYVVNNEAPHLLLPPVPGKRARKWVVKLFPTLLSSSAMEHRQKDVDGIDSGDRRSQPQLFKAIDIIYWKERGKVGGMRGEVELLSHIGAVLSAESTPGQVNFSGHKVARFWSKDLQSRPSELYNFLLVFNDGCRIKLSLLGSESTIRGLRGDVIMIVGSMEVQVGSEDLVIRLRAYS